MPLQVINGVGQSRIRGNSSGGAAVSFDADAQTFITNTSISDSTQQNAINNLVLDLKAANIWTKMNAIYPMIGGTATAHKFNLKDPRDLDDAYRLQFNGGWTHSSSGATPNGTDGYAKTFISTSMIGLNTGHLSYYSRTNDVTNFNSAEIGAAKSIPDSYTALQIRSNGSTLFRWNNSLTNPTVSLTDTLGFYIASRTANNVMNGYKNGTVVAGFSNTAGSNATTTIKMYLGAFNSVGTSNTVTDAPVYYSNKQCAFASIGSGLTVSESQLFYQIVEKYQVALGRNVNATKSFYFNRSYANETNAFIFKAEITDTTQISAIDTMVTTLKSAGVWTKMIAVYPMVGGTSNSHLLNLKTIGTYDLGFAGGWTFSSGGSQPNGSNSLATTGVILDINSTHLSYYSRTQSISNAVIGSSRGPAFSYGAGAYIRTRNPSNQFEYQVNTNNGPYVTSNSDSLGFFIVNRTSSTVSSNFIRGVKTQISSTSTAASVNDALIGAIRTAAAGGLSYGNQMCAFASLGYGLSDDEATSLTNAVQSFQTSLGRQV